MFLCTVNKQQDVQYGTCRNEIPTFRSQRPTALTEIKHLKPYEYEEVYHSLNSTADAERIS